VPVAITMPDVLRWCLHEAMRKDRRTP